MDMRLRPWDYPEYLALIRGEISYHEEDDDYDCDYSPRDDVRDDNVCCDRCGGGGCNWCLMTDY